MSRRSLRLTSLAAFLTLSAASTTSAGICDLTVNGATCGSSPLTNFAIFGEASPERYREFFLDINASDSAQKELLSLDALRIYLSTSGERDSSDVLTKRLNGLTAIYDLDSGGDNWIKLNYGLNHLSGPGEMVAYIPNSLFTGASTQYVYFFSRFGAQKGQEAEAGFEEWWVSPTSFSPPVTVTEVPEPATLLLLGTGLTLAARRRRKRAC